MKPSSLDEFSSEDSIGWSQEDHSSKQENAWETFASEDPACIAALETDRLRKPRRRGELSDPALVSPIAARAVVGRRPYAAVLAVTLTTAAGVWGVSSWQRRSAGLHSPAGASTSTSTSRAAAPVPPPRISDAVVPPPVATGREKTVGPSGNSRTPERGELSGSWVLTNRIEQSSVAAFHDLTLTFRLQLNQDGNHVSGQGLKWEENGRPIHSRGRTPIAVKGTIEGNKVVLSFTERGTRRTSHGRLELQLTDDGVSTVAFRPAPPAPAGARGRFESGAPKRILRRER